MWEDLVKGVGEKETNKKTRDHEVEWFMGGCELQVSLQC